MIFITKPVDSTLQRRHTSSSATTKVKSKRSDSASASELAIKQTLANLQSTFASYKKAFERRLVSHRSAAYQSTTSPKQQFSLSNGGEGSAVLLRTMSELKSSSLPTNASPPQSRHAASENHIGMRSNTYTSDPRSSRRSTAAEKDKSAANAVKDKVASFNKRAQDEEQIKMPNFGISFDVRPRAGTADPSVGRAPDSTKIGSPKQRADAKKVVTENQEEKKLERGSEETTKVEETSPSSDEVASVPLRRKKGRGRGLSKDERKQKIAAIRELFETSDLANIMSEPGRQWRPAGLENTAARRLNNSARKASEDSTSVVTDSSNLESESATSLSAEVVNKPPPVDESLPASLDTSKTMSESESGVVEGTEETLNKHEEVTGSGLNESSIRDDNEDRKETTSPSVVLSPPPEIRPRLQTAPAIYKTVVKDLSSSKQQVITLNFDQPSTPTAPAPLPSSTLATKPKPLSTPQVSDKQDKITMDVPEIKGGSLERNLEPTNFTRDTRATRSMSPQYRRRVGVNQEGVQSQQTSPGRNRRIFLQVSGKVSSLRDMFDNQAQTNKVEASPIVRKRSSSESKQNQAVKKVSPSSLSSSGADSAKNIQEKTAHQRSSSMDISTRRAPRAIPPPVQEESSSLSPSPPQHKRRELSPDIIPVARPQPVRPSPQKESPLTSSMATESRSPPTPPRPQSPIGYLLEKEEEDGESGSDLETDSDGSIYESDTSSLDDIDLEWVGGEDEVDLPWGVDDLDTHLAEQRMFKSLRYVYSVS